MVTPTSHPPYEENDAIDDSGDGHSGVSHRALQDVEQERSEGSVQTMNRIFGVRGLRLGVCRIIAPPLDGGS